MNDSKQTPLNNPKQGVQAKSSNNRNCMKKDEGSKKQQKVRRGSDRSSKIRSQKDETTPEIECYAEYCAAAHKHWFHVSQHEAPNTLAQMQKAIKARQLQMPRLVTEGDYIHKSAPGRILSHGTARILTRLSEAERSRDSQPIPRIDDTLVCTFRTLVKSLPRPPGEYHCVRPDTGRTYNPPERGVRTIQASRLDTDSSDDNFGAIPS
ncbi:unnamed protein product [Soboliphyme baturini]|uniref:Uncharacterized protein n=1 Tax=Soboliphyme baturini TaxID=241478 RepID=A0A183IYJ5_9BILA|nr:unnamed protein product [Soboliphyme baturini]